MKMSSQSLALTKFAWTCAIFQLIFGILFVLFVRYSDSADAKHVENQLGKSHELKENLEKYPAVLDIHMMLIGGFGFLMTFLKRFGFSAVGLTMLVVAICTEWSILLWGFTKIDQSYTIQISMMDVLEAGLTSAAVLISFGALLGKINPFQLLVMSLIESVLFVANGYIGYKVLGAVDVGGTIFIHTFGAYFGVAAALVLRDRKFEASEKAEGSRYTSDIFAMIGTVLLWIYWPSFNAILANNDGYHRAVMNTYISLLGSTIATFVVSSFFGHSKKFDMVDVQNATLSGGIAVGAMADLMIQPYGAFIAGTFTGTISCLGYRVLQPVLFKKLKLHDTCGVHNLHGMPGVIGAIASAIVCAMASKEIYGPSLYIIFPHSAPLEGSSELRELKEIFKDDEISAGEGRSMTSQALMQLAALAITMAVALIFGALTGLLLRVKSLFNPQLDHQLFDDLFFWHVPGEDEEEDEKHLEMLDVSQPNPTHEH